MDSPLTMASGGTAKQQMKRAEDRHLEPATFVARLWVEHEPQSAPKWYGKVRHVQGNQETYFNSLEELQSFLQEVSGVPAFDELKTVTPGGSQGGTR